MQWNGSGPGLGIALKLSQLRSAVLVGTALATKYPDEAAWNAVVDDPEFQETMSAVAQILDDVSADLDSVDETKVFSTIENHHQRTLEAVEVLAEALEVSAEDVVAVLSS